MAKLSGPLFSLEAHGTLGDALTFSGRKSGAQVRFQKKQKGTASATQETQRSYFSKAMTWWAELNDAEKAEWLVLGRTDC